MTVAAISPISRYSGDGSTVTFNFSWTFKNAADVVVTRYNADDSVSSLILNVDYTVTGGNGAAGSVTLTLAPATGETLVVERVTAAQQTTDLVPGQSLPAETLESTLDDHTRRLQELEERSARAMPQPKQEAPASIELPGTTARASKYLGFDAAGKPIAVSAGVPSAVTTSLGRGLIEAAAASVIFGLLGISALAQNVITATTTAAMRTLIEVDKAGEPVTVFDTVADLKAASGIYAARGAGKLWQAGRHVYTEAASDATDHHITTVGGVKLYALPGEMGLIDVEALGVVPDGETNWENDAIWSTVQRLALSPGVLFPPGFYANSINMSNAWSGARLHAAPGAVFEGVLHLISSAAPTRFTVTSIARASNVVTVNTSAAHGKQVGDRIQVKFTESTGAGSVSFNVEDVVVASVPSTTSLTFAQTGPDATGTTVSGSLICELPLKDLSLTGHWTTTDRLGTINCKDVYIQYCHVKSDPDNHAVFPNTSCRGAHLYFGTENLRIETLIIDDAVGSNSDAALNMDGGGWNPRNININYCLVKDSACNGAYITGSGHWFGKLEIRGFAREPFSNILQDSNGAAQSSRVKSFWINRCWDTRIDNLITDQIVSESRAPETAHALIDETGLSTYAESYNGVSVGNWTAKNVRRQGIRIGENATEGSTPIVNFHVENMEVHLSSEGLGSGQYGLYAHGGTTYSNIMIGNLTLVDFATNKGVYWDNNADGEIRSLTGINHGAQLVYQRGRLRLGQARVKWSGGSSTDPVWELAHPSVQGSYLGPIELDAPTITTQLFKAGSTSTGLYTVEKFISRGARHPSGLIELDSQVGVHINSFDCVGPDSNHTFLRLTNYATDVFLGQGRCNGYALGIDKNGSTMTRVKAVGLNVSANTAATNLLAGDIDHVLSTSIP